MSLEKNMLANHSTTAGPWFSNFFNPPKPSVRATFLEETEGHRYQDRLTTSRSSIICTEGPLATALANAKGRQQKPCTK